MFFFFNDTATTEIYTLSLHDALPISLCNCGLRRIAVDVASATAVGELGGGEGDRKSTRLNSSHGYISYAVFCLKKKKKPRCRWHGCMSRHHEAFAPRRGSRRRHCDWT